MTVMLYRKKVGVSYPIQKLVHSLQTWEPTPRSPKVVKTCVNIDRQKGVAFEMDQILPDLQSFLQILRSSFNTLKMGIKKSIFNDHVQRIVIFEVYQRLSWLQSYSGYVKPPLNEENKTRTKCPACLTSWTWELPHAVQHAMEQNFGTHGER